MLFVIVFCRSSSVLVPILIGMLGVANGIFLWPFLFIDNWLGWESLEFPTGGNLTLVLGGSVLASSSNITFMLSAALASPLFVAIGSVLQIPLSMLCDWVLHGDFMTPAQLGGTVLIVGGFVAQVVADYALKQKNAVPRKYFDNSRRQLRKKKEEQEAEEMKTPA